MSGASLARTSDVFSFVSNRICFRIWYKICRIVGANSSRNELLIEDPASTSAFETMGTVCLPQSFPNKGDKGEYQLPLK